MAVYLVCHGPVTAPNWRVAVAQVEWASGTLLNGIGCLMIDVALVVSCFSSRIDWRHLEFVLTDSKLISVSNCETELKDKIELKDRLVKMSVGFGYLIVLTSGQGLIYK